MAGVTLDELPPAIELNGNELVWLYQQGPTQATPWIGVRCTVNQLYGFINGTGLGACTMRQLAAALAAQGQLVNVLENLSGDVTDSYNIAWQHARIMTVTDPFSTGFLQPTLGYNIGQMIALYAYALEFPA